MDQAASERVEAFLSSAASRLQEVQMERRWTVEDTNAAVGPATRKHQQEALLGPQLALATAPSRSKTVSSAEGVLQNPLGRHEGKRVWGGGIVKLRKSEWIPWAIDQLVKEEQADHPETQHAGKDGPAFVHRVTELARGEGLSSIASVSWGAGVGNVHTAAVPPWMVQTEEEYKKCNLREQAAPTSSSLTKTADDRAEATTTKRRDIFGAPIEVGVRPRLATELRWGMAGGTSLQNEASFQKSNRGNKTFARPNFPSADGAPKTKDAIANWCTAHKVIVATFAAKTTASTDSRSAAHWKSRVES